MIGSEIITAGRNINTLSQDWCTPTKYVDIIHKFFNYNLDVDVCSNNESLIEAKIKYILPIDGLKESWNYSTIYINPPYGRNKDDKTTIKDWIKKAYETHYTYNSEIIMLIPVATNTSHWKEYIFGKATSICFLYDTRLKFRINGNENNKGCPMACCVVYYGNNKDRFKTSFINCGYVINIY